MIESQSFKLVAGGIQFHVQRWGARERPPLVFLHGLASTSHIADLIAPRLAQDYRVIAYDQRGHGESDKPDSGYDFETVASDLDKLLDALGYADKPVILAGHSWGAFTVLYYAATRPERVSRAILIDGALRIHRDRFPTWEEAEKSMTPPVMVNMTAEVVRRNTRERWLGEIYRPELEPLALSVYDFSDPANVQRRLPMSYHMQIARHLWEFQPMEYYARVQCPILCVVAIPTGADIDDQIQHRAAEALKVARGLKVVWMRETVHDIPWHRPDMLVAVMREFLTADFK